MRLLKGRVSLSTKYAGLVMVAFLLPTCVYLVFDVLFLRDALLELQVDSLMHTARVVAQQLDPEHSDFDDRVRDVLRHHAAFRPDLDILVIDRNARVLAATRPTHQGRKWQENGIEEVLQGTLASDWAVMQHDGADVLDVTVPVLDPQGRVVLAIHMARALPSVEAEIREVTWRHGLFFLITAVLAIVILAAGTYWLVLKRLRTLDAAIRIPSTERKLPSAIGYQDEIDTLTVVVSGLVDELSNSAETLQQSLVEKEAVLKESRHFNERLEQEVAKVRHELTAAQQSLIHAEHLSTIGQLAAGLAHEVRNPLFIIRGYAARLRKQVADRKDMCDDIITEVDRVNRIIKRLLEIGQPTTLELQKTDLREVLEKAVARARQSLDPESGVSIHLYCEQAYPVRADPQLLRQALANVLDNAIKAVGARGNVTVEAVAQSERIEVSIIDQGTGIEKSDLDRIFDPFFTRTTGGTGLGLCAAKKVFDLHHAEVRVESEPGKGTTVRVSLPAWPARQPAASV